MRKWLFLLPLLVCGCVDYVYDDLNSDTYSYHRGPPTNPGNGNNSDTGLETCYVLTDTSQNLNLLNPNSVEVHHFNNTNISGWGEEKRILFIFTNHSGTPIVNNDASSVDFGMAEFGQRFFENADGTRLFFEEASFGEISITGTVVGWMDFPDSSTANLSLNGGGFLALAEQYVDVADYDILALASTYPGQLISGSGTTVDCIDLNGTTLDYSGLTYFQRPRALTVGNDINTTGIAAVMPDSIYAHEITHALGVAGHAISLDCDNVSWDTDCSIIAYGDPFSIQGDRVFSSHPGAWHKQLLGWIDESAHPTVTDSGTYVLHPVEVPKGDVYGLSIPLATPLILDNGVEYDRVMVDYRQPEGFDYRINNINDYNYVWGLDPGIDTDGAYLYFGYANGSHSTALINTHPDEPHDELRRSPHGFPGETGRNAHAMLNIGETFDLPNGTGSITVLGHVDVNMPGVFGYPNNTVQGLEISVEIL